MSNTKTVAIITVLSDDKDDIIRAIESIKNQTYKDYIHFIYDNGSGRRSLILDYLKERPDKRVKFASFRSKVSSSRAKNLILKDAKDTDMAYFAMLEPNDFWAMDHLEKCITFLEKENASMVYSATSFINKQHAVLTPYGIPYDQEPTYNNILQANTIMPSSVMLRKECVDTVGGFDEDLELTEYWDYWVRVLIMGFSIYRIPLTTATVCIMDGDANIYNANVNKLRKKYNLSAGINLDKLRAVNEDLFGEIFTENQYKIDLEDVKNKVFVDVGANYGFVSLFAVVMGAKKVLAFEPNSANFEVLSDLTKDHSQISIYKQAVYNTQTFVNISDEGMTSTIFKADGLGEGVKTISLKEISDMINPVDAAVLKLDCEGAEFDIIYNAPQETVQRFDTILLEIHNDLDPKYINGDAELIRYLESLGFECEKLPFTSGIWSPDGKEFTPTANTFYKCKKSVKQVEKPADKPVKLHLGCGSDILEGYINCDMFNPAADMLFDIREIPFPDNSVDEIKAYHVIEHLCYHDGFKALAECYRVLKKGGKIVLETPDFFNLCKTFVESDDDTRVRMYPMFFASPDGIPGEAHLFLYTEDQLILKLQTSGFKNWVRNHPDSHHYKGDLNRPYLYLNMTAYK